MTSSAQPNPAAVFYGGGRVARWFSVALRAAHGIAPAIGTRLALRLFSTPLPLKTTARRRPVPAPWRAERFPLEGGSAVLWRRPDLEGGANPAWAIASPSMRICIASPPQPCTNSTSGRS